MKRQETDAQNLFQTQHMSQFELRASYVEVWKERVYDLLATEGRKALPLRDDSESGSTHSFAVGAVSEHVQSTRALLKLIECGSSRRATASTGQNEHSSRSHAVLILSLEHRWRSSVDGTQGKGSQGVGGGKGPHFQSRISRMTLVDLAGSESTAKAHGGSADGAGCAINQGLLVLGQVCERLSSSSGSGAHGGHVPFRSSTLTRLLQGCFTGRCRTHLLACIRSDSEYQVVMHVAACTVQCTPSKLSHYLALNSTMISLFRMVSI